MNSKRKSPLENLNKMMRVSISKDEMSRVDEECETKEHSLFSDIIRDLGGFSIAMGAAKTATSCATKLFPNNKAYQKFSRVAEGAIPMFMTGQRVFSTVKRAMSNRKRRNRPKIDEEKFVMAFLFDCVDEKGEVDWWSIEENYADGPEIVIDWLMSSPKTGIIVTDAILDRNFDVISQQTAENSFLSYYIYRIPRDDDKDIQFAMKVERNFLGKITSQRMMYESVYFYKAIKVMYTYAYMESLNLDDNIVMIRGVNDISVVPKKRIAHDVYQMDESFLVEVKKSLEKEKKRGYALVGSPGTGKTTVVDKIIDKLRDVAVMYIQIDHSITHPAEMMDCLVMCQMVAPCIVVFEDIDSLPLKHKDSPYLQALIEYMDSAKFDAPIIFIATMNEPENIHESLMDRRGRFDKIMMVDPPSTHEQIVEVFRNIYLRETGEEAPEDIISDEFAELVRNHDIRHSDFAEAINRVILHEMPTVPENFTKALAEICNTQIAIDKFKVRKSSKKRPENMMKADYHVDADLPDELIEEEEMEEACCTALACSNPEEPCEKIPDFEEDSQDFNGGIGISMEDVINQ